MITIKINKIESLNEYIIDGLAVLCPDCKSKCFIEIMEHSGRFPSMNHVCSNNDCKMPDRPIIVDENGTIC